MASVSRMRRLHEDDLCRKAGQDARVSHARESDCPYAKGRRRDRRVWLEGWVQMHEAILPFEDVTRIQSDVPAKCAGCTTPILSRLRFMVTVPGQMRPCCDSITCLRLADQRLNKDDEHA